MPISDYPKVQNLINSGYEFRFSHYLDTGWKLFQQTPGLFIGGFIALMLFIFALVFIPIVGIIALPFIATIISIGFYIVAHKNATQTNAEFNDFLGGFQFTKEIVLRVIATFIITTIVSIPYYIAIWDTGYFDWYMNLFQNWGDWESIAGLGNPPEVSPVYNLLQIPAYYLSIAYVWSDLFILFKGMSFWDAMEASRQVVTKKWFNMLGLVIVLVLIALVGALLCGLGLIVAIPLMSCVIYASFADVVGLYDVEDTQDDILDHLVED